MLIATMVFIVGADWGAKPLSFPADASRIQFDVYLPKASEGCQIERTSIVWIPTLADFPARQPRQAVLFELKAKGGASIQLLETPTKNSQYREILGEILSQGYLRPGPQKGESWPSIEKGATSVCILTKSFDYPDLYKWGEGLVLFHKS
ncbi:MAG: hypothetical protein JST51_07605 [Armatimonadetes bacterium]|nr:hypothetical protein [Armatimonadota bacterium]